MAVNHIFDFHKMVSWVAKYFQENDFEVKEHCIHQGMKVHVYAYKELKSKKSKGKKKYDEVIVEVSVSEEIPPLLIGENLGKYDEKVGLLTHFQTYFHPSKIYLAPLYLMQVIILQHSYLYLPEVILYLPIDIVA
ncbi:hypothetical protein ES703_107038 [subsurface metagenome]